MGIILPDFCPRSQGFYEMRFSTEQFTATEICEAIQCISDNSLFFRGLLATLDVDCVTVQNNPCPGNPDSLDSCATTIRNLLTEAGAGIALGIRCPLGPSELNAILRQYLTNLLNICLSTTIVPQGCVGGVLEGYRVNLTAEERTALGFTADECVTVEEILDRAEAALSACGVGFTADFLATLATVLRNMAQDVGTTIIDPVFC